jgi:hypothetical protein
MVKLCLCLTKNRAINTYLLIKHHALKAYWGNGGIAPRIHNLCTRWRRVVSFRPPPLSLQGKSSEKSLDSRLGVPLGQSGPGGQKRTPLSLPGVEPRQSTVFFKYRKGHGRLEFEYNDGRKVICKVPVRSTIS